MGVLSRGIVATAAVYQVAKVGIDTNDGSAVHPFLTISACAQIAQPGDTCEVHAGVYRETVTPPRSGTATQPLRFAAADGECAMVSGTEPLTSTFTNTGGNVWRATVADDIAQMFSNGTMIWEAQWPNRTPGALFDTPKGVARQGTGVVATADGGSVSFLVDPDIPDGDWTGANVFILPGARWQSDSRPISVYDQMTHTITFDTSVPWAERSTQPIASNQYYLYGSRLALDAQDEWVIVRDRGAPAVTYGLFFFSVDDPSTHGLEFKKRAYAFDMNQSNVEIVGFHVFGAAVRIEGDANTVDSLTIEYPTHLRAFNAYYTEGDVNRIVGNDNTWKNSIIEKSGSAGLIVAGNGNRIENNIANDVTYQATNHAGLDMDNWQAHYQGNVFSYNTVARSGRAGIFQMGAKSGRVLFNRVTDWALLTNDTGGIYSWGTDGEGTEIAYNDLGGSTAFWCNGVYLDDRTKHFVAHHNFVHDSTYYAFNVKEENEYFSNTIANVGTPFLVDKDFQNGLWEHTDLAKIEDNLTDGTILIRVGLLPTGVTDSGYFDAPVHATNDWRHAVVPFSSMKQPSWFVQKPFDRTSVQQLAFTPYTNGDFELDVDNVRLEGPTPILLDDFEGSGAPNALGGAPWGGASGDGGTSTSGVLTYLPGGPAGSSVYARFAGTVVLGDNSWGLFLEPARGRDLSAYTGVSFDVRGRMRGFRVLATGGSPMQDHNVSCAFSGTNVPPCAAGQGATLAGMTDVPAAAAPDVGAFDSTRVAWTAGARRPDDATICGKIADIDAGLPAQVANPWQDTGLPVWGVDGSVGEAGADAMTTTGDAADSSLLGRAQAAGCGCRIGGLSNGYDAEEGGGRVGASLSLATLGMVLFGVQRRRARHPLPESSPRTPNRWREGRRPSVG